MGVNPVFMSTATAALYLGVGAGTLRDWRRRRIGPSYIPIPERRRPARPYRLSAKRPARICGPPDHPGGSATAAACRAHAAR